MDESEGMDLNMKKIMIKDNTSEEKKRITYIITSIKLDN